MSIRSNVMILLKKNNFDELINVINKTEKELLDFDYISKKDEEVLVGWRYLKWYPGYPAVKGINDLLFDYYNKGIPYKFSEVTEFGDIYLQYNNGQAFKQNFDTSLIV